LPRNILIDSARQQDSVSRFIGHPWAPAAEAFHPSRLPADAIKVGSIVRMARQLHPRQFPMPPRTGQLRPARFSNRPTGARSGAVGHQHHRSLPVRRSPHSVLPEYQLVDHAGLARGHVADLLSPPCGAHVRLRATPTGTRSSTRSGRGSRPCQAPRCVSRSRIAWTFTPLRFPPLDPPGRRRDADRRHDEHSCSFLSTSAAATACASPSR